MHTEHLKISIGLCTFKRQHLTQTLVSLFQQTVPSHVEITEIIVVDNDVECSARERVAAVKPPTGWNIIYVSEPQKNISAARNQILQNATGQWLALLDDDEVADPSWIEHYVKAIHERDAVAFFGPIISLYSKKCPQWVSQGGFFDRRIHADGAKVQTGSTGNVIINLLKIRQKNMQFSLAYGLTGGEDSYLFYTLFLSGESMYWVSNAIVREQVEEHRLNQEFLEKKSFRIGQTFSRYRMIDRPVSLIEKYRYQCHNRLKFACCFLAGLALNLVKKRSTTMMVQYMKYRVAARDAQGKLAGLRNEELIELYK